MLRDSCNTTKNTNCPKYRKAISHYNGFKDGSAIVIKESIKILMKQDIRYKSFRMLICFGFYFYIIKVKT